MDWTLALKIAGAGFATLVLGWRLANAYTSERGARAHMLDGFRGAIAGASLDRDPQGLPRVSGHLDGSPLMIALNADTLALRTLPTLWLQAHWARPHGGTVDLLLDPSGTEYFLEHPAPLYRTDPPAGWPDTVVTLASGAEAAPLLESLGRIDPARFPALKHVLVDRRELRVTLRCARADRQTYRVLRSATFKPDAVAAELVTQTIEALREIEAAVGGSRPDADAAPRPHPTE